MRSVAVICEYNPFHRGHEWLLKSIREKFPGYTVISVMSGNTVQRGDFAVYGKYFRAKCAVLGGSDIVAELPFPYACSAGEQFAMAGVRIAAALGAEYLAFGSESGDIEALRCHAAALLSPEFDSELGNFARAHPEMSFIRSREAVYRHMYGVSLPTGSNDMLATEYLKAIISGGNTMTPVVFRRVNEFSATESREALKSRNEAAIELLIPPGCTEAVLHPGLRGISSLILGYLRFAEPHDDGSGIVNSLVSCARRTNNFDLFLSSLPTSVYTSARLRREIIGALLGVDDSDRNKEPSFTVLLGASKAGREYLRKKRKSLSLPVLTKNSDVKNARSVSLAQLELCKRADSLYHLAEGRGDDTSFFGRPFISDDQG